MWLPPGAAHLWALGGHRNPPPALKQEPAKVPGAKASKSLLGLCQLLAPLQPLCHTARWWPVEGESSREGLGLEQRGAAASRAQDTLTRAVGRAPGVAYLCLGQSALVPHSMPASLPFLSWRLSPGTCQLEAYLLPRTKARCGWVCAATGLGRLIQEGTCTWYLQISQQPQLCLLPGVKDQDSGCCTSGNSPVHGLFRNS